MTIILGLNSGEFNSSACILKDGKVTFAVQEERLNREKFTKKFPVKSIQACLKHENIKLKDIDFVSIGWNPSAHMISYNSKFSGERVLRENNLYTISDNLFNLTKRSPGNYTLVKHENSQHMPEAYHVQHHMCHSSNAFFLSNFKNAAILTVDFKGENQCTTWSFGKNNKIKILQYQNIPNSLGIIYATFTALLGYKPDSDEWKVMAMSAYNVDCSRYVKKIKSTYQLIANGKLKLNKKYYGFFEKNNKKLYTKKLLKLLKVKKVFYKKKPTIQDISIAKALQLCSEEIAIHFLKHLYKLTKSKNLVLGGGFFMNSVFNGKIKEKTNFKNIFIPYAPTDTGNSIGSSLYTYYCILNKPRKKIFNSALLGPEYKNNEIKSVLKKRKVKFIKINNVPKVVAKICNDGEIVAYFNNRLEFRDRALGCRSIIADPRKAKIKKEINDSIKYREAYRPFAPSIIQNSASKFFEVPNNYECKYMEKVIKVKKEFTGALAAITHLDNSARLQTVNRKDNKDFYNILKEFEKLTKFPILLNTSFNINGEPMVNSPDDAISTFYKCNLKVMVIGNYLVRK